jgi:hypothetical protein
MSTPGKACDSRRASRSRFARANVGRWRTTEVTTKPLVEVDEAFAWDEGEGDRTRKWWFDAHRRYFARQAARDGFEAGDDIVTVFERFEVVGPPLDVADKMARPKLDGQG